MAVLPTPASPSSTGLFLVRRQRIWMTRSISLRRPMTGSSSPFFGHLGEVAAERAQGGVFTSPFFAPGSATFLRPWVALLLRSSGGVKFGSSSLRISLRVLSISTSRFFKTTAATPSPSRRSPSRMCSVPT